MSRFDRGRGGRGRFVLFLRAATTHIEPQFKHKHQFKSIFKQQLFYSFRRNTWLINVR